MVRRLAEPCGTGRALMRRPSRRQDYRVDGPGCFKVTARWRWASSSASPPTPPASTASATTDAANGQRTDSLAKVRVARRAGTGRRAEPGQHESDTKQVHPHARPLLSRCSSSRSSRGRNHHGEAQAAATSGWSAGSRTRHDGASLRHPHRTRKSLANRRHPHPAPP